MLDCYLYEDIPVLKNKLGIRDEKILDKLEAEQSRANMMLLYEQGLKEFTPESLCRIHQFLFGDLYEWAGKFRIINIEKREELLAGRSVWYSNDEAISQDLALAFAELHRKDWVHLSKESFVCELARDFARIWKVHPFREGNTRTVVMMLTLFVEAQGYFVDQELLARSAGYVRNSFVMASLDRFSEYEHLERILMDAICEQPVEYDADFLSAENQHENRSKKYEKYRTDEYVPQPHYVREDHT